MKMWSMEVIILLLFCYACLSTGSKTGRVKFVSRNFINILQWEPVEGGNAPYKYSVQYKNYAENSFQMKKECQNIIALSCDLSEETLLVHDAQYLAKVYVNGLLYGEPEKRLNPIADTDLGPPTLSTYTTVSSLHLNVTLPLGPKGVSVADIITSSKHGPSKTIIFYTLNITEPEWAAQVHETTTGKFAINLKNNETRYCGYVAYKPSIEWGRKESEKAHFCAMLQGDQLVLLLWLLIPAFLLVVLIIIFVVLMCKYVKGGKDKSMPQPLVFNPSTSSSVIQSPDGNLIISKLVVSPQSDRTVYTTIRASVKVPWGEVGGYSPQEIPCQAWPDSSGSSVGTGAECLTPNPEETSAQSSEIYSVVAVHHPTKDKDFQQAAMEDSKTSNLILSSSGGSWHKGGVPTLRDPEPLHSDPARPLMLHVVRDDDGQLMLPSLNFQLQSIAGDTQRRPLLSDLIDSKREGPSLLSLQSFDGSEWSDSGCDGSTLNTPTQSYCNTHYSLSQPVVPYSQQGCQSTPSSDASVESGYKHNWMPAILQESASTGSCEYRSKTHPWSWTGLKDEVECEQEEDRGGEERSREILLGGWMVHVQE